VSDTDYGYLNQPYVEDLLGIDAKPGEVRHVMIEHDDWCPALLGTGYCVCRPVVRPPNREERRRIARATTTPASTRASARTTRSASRARTASRPTLLLRPSRRPSASGPAWDISG
jgi:hypothetical protein